MDNKNNSEIPESEAAVAGLEKVEYKPGPKKTEKIGGVIVGVVVLITAAIIGMFDKVSLNVEITSLIGTLAALIVGPTFLWNRYGVLMGLISLAGAIIYMVKFQ